MQRREFFVFLTLLSGGVFPLASNSSANPTKRLWMSAANDRAGRHYFTLLFDDGSVAHEYSLAYRGHGIAVNQKQKLAVLFARRPGTQALVVDYSSGEKVCEFTAPAQRHFYGHGCFDKTGSKLFASLNNYQAAVGQIDVRNTQDLSQSLFEWSSHGIEPHAIGLWADEKTLVVANGGRITHPDKPRKILNPDNITSSLVYMHSETGQLLDKQSLSDPYLSLRHIAVAADGGVAVAIQDAKPGRRGAALVALSQPGKALRLLSIPDVLAAQLSGYAADLAIDSDLGVLLVSAPKDNLLLSWSYPDGEFLAAIPVNDVAGIGVRPAKEGFLLSNGEGGWFQLDQKGLNANQAELLDKASNRRWDNHLHVL